MEDDPETEMNVEKMFTINVDDRFKVILLCKTTMLCQ